MPNSKKELNDRFIFDNLEFYLFSTKIEVNISDLFSGAAMLRSVRSGL